MSAELSQLLRGAVGEFCTLGLLARQPESDPDVAQTLVEAGIITKASDLRPVFRTLVNDGSLNEIERAIGVTSYRLTERGATRLETFRWLWRDFSATVQGLVD